MAHIPDGFLSASVSATTLVAAGAVTAYAARRSQQDLDERAAPTLGLATAAVFAAQAVNFPVAAGTSGHLLGGVLVAVLFGPWAGCLVMTSVLVVQALIFADGGLTAIGANVLNIAGVGAVIGYGINASLITLAGGGPRRRGLAAAAAAYVATVLTGIAAGIELGWSGVAPMRLSVGAMASVHAVMGLAESAITGLAVWTLARKRPDLLHASQTPAPPGPTRRVVLAGLGGLAILAGVLSLIASSAPDSLERVAIDLGFADAATVWEGALFPEYRAWLPGFVGKMIAFVLSIALLFAGAAAMFRALGFAREARET
jgi:cobalt/nickel transport system permease protein